MYSLIFLFFTSLVASLLLTPLVRDLFIYMGIMDHPDSDRKIHRHPIPRLGGISIAGAYGLSYIVLLWSPLSGGILLARHLSLVWMLLPGVACIFFTGLIDDVFTLKPYQKLAGQLLGAILAYEMGIRIHAVGGHSTDDWWSLPLTILWLLFCTNAFNLIDGLDGLAVGIGLIGTLTMLVASLLDRHIALALATVPLVGGLLGFLRYNFNPASVFLGDSGSLMIGFLLACYGVIWSHNSTTLMGMFAPVMALALPTLDLLLSIARRFLSKRPILSGDRGHVHHRLLDRGFSPKQVAAALYAASALGACLALLQTVFARQLAGVVTVLFILFAWAGVRYLNYNEFAVTYSMLINGSFLTLVSNYLLVADASKRLSAATDIAECWRIVKDIGERFGYKQIELRISGGQYERELQLTEQETCYTVRFYLNASDYISLVREDDSPIRNIGLLPWAELVQRSFKHRLQELGSRPCSVPITDIAAAVPQPAAKSQSWDGKAVMARCDQIAGTVGETVELNT